MSLFNFDIEYGFIVVKLCVKLYVNALKLDVFFSSISIGRLRFLTLMFWFLELFRLSSDLLCVVSFDELGKGILLEAVDLLDLCDFAGK